MKIKMICPNCKEECRKERYCTDKDTPFKIHYMFGSEPLFECGKCKQETPQSTWDRKRT